jgi:catechol 2,3-dioxygenase-like lactoylglutathione lyase family enzyme
VRQVALSESSREGSTVTKTLRLGPQLVPSLLVSDLWATFAFYETLGFTRSGAFPEDAPVWGEVTRDGISIQFYTEPPHGTPSEPLCSGTFYVRTSDVLALAEELEAIVPFAWGPEVMDYGMREFAVRDPDGYFLAFTEPA